MSKSEVLVRTYDGRVKSFLCSLDHTTVQQLKAMIISGILSNVAGLSGLALQKQLLEGILLDYHSALLSRYEANKSQIEVQNVKLIHEGKPLDDDSAPLSKYAAKSRSEVEMVKRVHGVKSRFEVQMVMKVHGG